MLKKSFWIFVFLLATFAAYLAADTVSLYLKTLMDVPPVTAPSRPIGEKKSEEKQKRKEYYQIINQRDLFQVQPQNGEADQKDADEVKEAEKVAPLTALKLKLLGTMIGNGILPFAIILDQRSRKQDLYTVGDKVGPAEILKIYRNKVILLHEGQEEMLLAFEDMEDILEANLDTPQESPSDRESPSSQIPTRIGKRVGQNHWVLERSEVEKVIENSSQLLTQLRIIPHFAKGKMDEPDGFQVANIKARSLFDMMGLRNGDVIKSVNRQAVDNPEKAFAAYQQFKKESQIEVVVLRGNREVTLRYDINE